LTASVRVSGTSADRSSSNGGGGLERWEFWRVRGGGVWVAGVLGVRGQPALKVCVIY